MSGRASLGGAPRFRRIADDEDLDEPDELLGTTIADRYRLESLIGEGGMGRVYLAEHVALGKKAAVKVLSDRRTVPRAADRFLREAQATAAIGHENIVDITDYGEAPNGAVFIVMEYLEGEDLASTIDRDAPLPWTRVRRIGVQLCRGLGAAHELGIIHRDMKPENCFRVSKRDHPDFIKLLDFGIAKLTAKQAAKQTARQGGRGRGRLTRTGNIFGTPEYMAPEQAKGGEIDHRVDIYAVGIILFELLTGLVPFTGDSFVGVMMRQVQDPVPPPSAAAPDAGIPPEVDALVLKALEKDPNKRYASMTEMAAALLAVHARPLRTAAAVMPVPATRVDTEEPTRVRHRPSTEEIETLVPGLDASDAQAAVPSESTREADATGDALGHGASRPDGLRPAGRSDTVVAGSGHISAAGGDESVGFADVSLVDGPAVTASITGLSRHDATDVSIPAAPAIAPTQNDVHADPTPGPLRRRGRTLRLAGAVALGAALIGGIYVASSGSEDAAHVPDAGPRRASPSDPTPPAVDEGAPPSGEPKPAEPSARDTGAEDEVIIIDDPDQPPVAARSTGARVPPLSRAQIERGLRKVKAALPGCRSSMLGTKAGDRVRIKLVVEAGGRVRSATASGSSRGKAVGDCVASLARKAQFPRFVGAPYTFRYTFTL